MNRSHVVSLEWAKKLTTAKIRLQSLYTWYSYDKEQWACSFNTQPENQKQIQEQHPAYLATELLNLIPKTLKTFHKESVDEILTEEDGWLGYPFNIDVDPAHGQEVYWVGYIQDKNYYTHAQNQNLCDALAELAIWCQKHKFLSN